MIRVTIEKLPRGTLTLEISNTERVINGGYRYKVSCKVDYKDSPIEIFVTHKPRHGHLALVEKAIMKIRAHF